MMKRKCCGDLEIRNSRKITEEMVPDSRSQGYLEDARRR